jgi:2-polyprenyl-3-methyl-5-hydroxy-6-metoxy-1,4-benzoquinol methylase
MNEPVSTNESRLAELQEELRNSRRLLQRLRERVALLETTLELVSGDDRMLWLYRNRSERMDATVAMFPEARRRFHLARYLFAARYVAEKRVADIACGTGYGCRTLVETGGAANVTGIDHDADAIAYARQQHGLPEVQYALAPADRTPIAEGSLDCVVSFETIEHVPEDAALIDEFARILRPNGLLICSTPNQWPLDIAPHHVRVYTRDSFLQALDRRFSVEQMFNQNSGSDFPYNHGQPEGIVETTDGNADLAECFIAVARRR